MALEVITVCNAGDGVRSLGQEDPPGKKQEPNLVASCLRPPWTEGSLMAKNMGSERVRHDFKTATTITPVRVMKVIFSLSEAFEILGTFSQVLMAAGGDVTLLQHPAHRMYSQTGCLC